MELPKLDLKSLKTEAQVVRGELVKAQQDVQDAQQRLDRFRQKLGHIESLIALETPSSTSQSADWFAVAESRLREAGVEGMHYRALADAVIKSGTPISGKDPANSLNARFFHRKDRFERIGRGIYRIKQPADKEGS
jgi:hypothetical protein